MAKTTQRVIITGGPGTGKSSIIGELEKMGYPCFTEVSRAVIKEEMAKGTNLVPWRDLPGFSDKVFKGQTRQYHEAQEGKINFYDRGMVDVIAYLRKDHEPTDGLDALVEHYPYHHMIFLTPPWHEIYSTDEERKEALEDMEQIHHSLMDTYRSFGYEVVEVPRVALDERVAFILKQLEQTS